MHIQDLPLQNTLTPARLHIQLSLLSLTLASSYLKPPTRVLNLHIGTPGSFFGKKKKVLSEFRQCIKHWNTDYNHRFLHGKTSSWRIGFGLTFFKLQTVLYIYITITCFSAPCSVTCIFTTVEVLTTVGWGWGAVGDNNIHAWWHIMYCIEKGMGWGWAGCRGLDNFIQFHCNCLSCLGQHLSVGLSSQHVKLTHVTIAEAERKRERANKPFVVHAS